MKSSNEPMAEVLTDLLNSLNNVGIETRSHNTSPYTGAFLAFVVKVKTKISQMFN